MRYGFGFDSNTRNLTVDLPGDSLPVLSINLISEEAAFRRGEQADTLFTCSDAVLHDRCMLHLEAMETYEYDDEEGVPHGLTADEILRIIGLRGVDSEINVFA